jgi:hypothetical protein
MPDVLARDVTEAEKDFIASYAHRHGLSQAETIRRAFRAGVDRLRASETADESDWDRLAASLAPLREDDFEAAAWG